MFRPLTVLIALAAMAGAATPPNTLSPGEKADGWRLLFDGQSTDGWVAFGSTGFPQQGWAVKEGELRLERADGKTPHVDLVTVEKFSDFEFAWEWKITEGGNSGVKYNLLEAKKGLGCEYQLIDDERHEDAKLHDRARSTGALYDVIAPALDKPLKPVGEWNQSVITVKGNHVRHLLNGAVVVEYDLGSPELLKLAAASKFAKNPEWGVKTASSLLLQDHGDEVAFRSLKVKALR